MRSAATLALLAVLTGCAGPSPEVLKGNQSFVTVSRPENTSRAATKDVANAYCGQHGKRAVFLSDACPEAYCAERSVTFWCQ